MFEKPLFDKSIEPSCSYCEHGKQAADRSILCEKQGVVQPSYRCRRFMYDPLKREPARTPQLGRFDASDFEL